MTILTKPGDTKTAYDLTLFVVDTDTSTEETTSREHVTTLLTAWMTGRCDSDYYGGEVSEAALEEANNSLAWVEDSIDCEPSVIREDHGIYRHCRSVQTPGYFWDGHDHTFTADQVPADGTNVFPAFQSVAVLFKRALTNVEQAQLRERARFFFAHFVTDAEKAAQIACDPTMLSDQAIRIIGFRLVQEHVLHTCCAVYDAEA